MISPRQRGWTPEGTRVNTSPPDFPAPAGMDLWRAIRARRCGGFPRASGDGPFQHRPAGCSRWISPRQRGWTHLVMGAHRVGGDFPAPAGMDLGLIARVLPAVRFPRASGDGPPCSALRRGTRRISPRQRGWTAYRSAFGVRKGDFPAPAGMDRARIEESGATS